MLYFYHTDDWTKYWLNYFSITVNANYLLQYYYNYIRYTNPKQILIPENFSPGVNLDEALLQTLISYLLILGAVNNIF